MVEKSLDTEKNILYVTSKGSIEVEGMMKGIDFLAKAKDLPRNLKILEDATEAKVAYGHSELEMLMLSMKKAIIHFESIRHAVLSTDPTNTAFAMLAGLMMNEPNYSLKVFSTKAAAEYWLMTTA
ncbi:MAG: hypothetical protein IPH88_06440 [Bacteroidales bacterium]|nr:hypothetical protein [Bacteroidales bacterium]